MRAYLLSCVLWLCLPGLAAAGELRSERLGVRLQLPAGWSSEDVAEQGTLLLSPVQEGGWQTNVYVEPGRNAVPGRTPDRMVDDLVEHLGREKQGFALKTRKSVRHASGMAGTEIVYTHTMDGVALTEKELILSTGGDRVLFATASAVTTLWKKYEREIDGVLTSIRPLAAPARARLE